MALPENTTSQKRQREEDTHVPEPEETKKHKSYNHILSILDEDEEEPTQDLSSLITTLQQEISSSEDSESTSFDLLAPLAADPEENPSAVPANLEDSSASSSASSVSNEEDDKERVMRHLLEASDDELGIPNSDAVGFDDGDEAAGQFAGGGDGFVLCDGLWEFEDEAANYYTLLQSELFM